LNPNEIKYNLIHPKIESLLKMIQDKIKGVEPTPPSALNPNEDMNKLDDQELNERKAAMDIDFEKHRVKPGDADFEYNKEIEFADTGNIESAWDEGDDYSDPEF
jgi:hypothetical protein